MIKNETKNIKNKKIKNQNQKTSKTEEIRITQ